MSIRLPPHGRVFILYGPTLTICVKVVSTGVHNIAFLHTPDVNYHFEIVMRLLSSCRVYCARCGTYPNYRNR